MPALGINGTTMVLATPIAFYAAAVEVQPQRYLCCAGVRDKFVAGDCFRIAAFARDSSR